MFTSPPTALGSTINGYLLRGAPVNQFYSGKVVYVDNSSTLPDGCVGGSDTNRGDYLHPFKTIAGAVASASATSTTLPTPVGAIVPNRGDIIAVMPGHVEPAITTAGGLAIPAGTIVLGLTDGTLKPSLSWTGTTASLYMGANSQLLNLTGSTNTTSLVSPIVIHGNGCMVDLEWNDGSGKEAIACVTCFASGYNDCRINLRYRGLVNSAVCVNPVKLNGVTNCNVNVDFYGKASTAVVNLVTTACSNVEVTGRTYNAAALAAEVVDTITGSTWGACYQNDWTGLTVQGSNNAPIQDITDMSAGSSFVLKKTVTSSAVTVAAQSLTNVSTGVIYINNIAMNCDGTGLAGMTNFTLNTNNVKGNSVFYSQAIAALGANANTTMSAGATKGSTGVALESGKLVQYAGTVAPGTGAGTVDLYIYCTRGSDGANLS